MSSSDREPVVLESVAMLEELLLRSEPLLMLFTSDFCHSCTETKRVLNSMLGKHEEVQYVMLNWGSIPGIEKAFGLQSTPAAVCMNRSNKIIVKRNCDRLSRQDWIDLLEGLYD